MSAKLEQDVSRSNPPELELQHLDLEEKLEELAELLNAVRLPTAKKDPILALVADILDDVEDVANNNGYLEGYQDGIEGDPVKHKPEVA